MPTRAPTPPIDPRDLDLTLRQLLTAHVSLDLLADEKPVPVKLVVEALKSLAWKRRGWKP